MKKQNVISALSALAHGVRLDIFRLLVQAGPDGMAAGDMAAALKIAGPNLTFHLSQLRQAGLVSSRRAGRNVIYAADFGRIIGLVDYLQQNCCAGVAPETGTETGAASTPSRQKELAS